MPQGSAPCVGLEDIRVSQANHLPLACSANHGQRHRSLKHTLGSFNDRESVMHQQAALGVRVLPGCCQYPKGGKEAGVVTLFLWETRRSEMATKFQAFHRRGEQGQAPGLPLDFQGSSGVRRWLASF